MIHFCVTRRLLSVRKLGWQSARLTLARALKTRAARHASERALVVALFCA